MDAAAATPLLAIENLSISFFTRAGEIPAVMNFSASVAPGEALGLVGESGCGKSTVALAVMRDLGRNGRITEGAIRFKGRDLVAMAEPELRKIRGSEIAMIYQEPMASLNPAMTVARQLMEVPMIHAGAGAAEARAQALRVVEAVRLPDPRRILDSYPHQLSGGQQQRIVIAMALMSQPALLILDEPTTALDVTVEAGIVQLVKDLGREFGTSMLFISHNLGLVLETCDRLCVMYSGEAVETGPIAEVFDEMRHPYTQGLFRALPLPGADRTRHPLVPIPGQFPLPHERPPGCNFGPRCSYFVAGRCDAGDIPMEPVTPTHATRCIRWDEIDWAAPPVARETAAPAPIGAVVLSVDGLRKYYQVGSNALFGGDTRVVKANEFGQLRRPRGRNPRHRRRERLREVDAGQGAPRPRDRHRGYDHPRRHRDRQHRRRGAPDPHRRLAADGLPEPLRHPQPEHEHRRPDRSRAGEIRRRQHQRRAPGPDVRAPRPRPPAPRLRRAPAAPALRRPEAAHRHRPRLRRRPRRRRRRRAGLGARRLGPGGGHRAPRRHPARPTARRCSSSATTSASCATSPTG